MATLYGVGVGPGDPELVTLKALRLLEEVPVICAPRSREEGESLAGEVVASLLGEKLRSKELLLLYFPMTRDRKVLEEAWREAASQVVARLRRGKDVAFVTLGDPSFYSTFPYLRQAVLALAPETRVAVVPGVSSLSSCMALGGVWVQEDERLAVIPVTGDFSFDSWLNEFDCLVFLKGGRHWGRLREFLAARGFLAQARLVERCSTPEEKVRLAAEVEKAPYLSQVIVHRSRF
ncbi:precorrin-2 C(20)-methyltransferase [Ammonifex thiophilus]|uniref:Precorrin-2 C(20)-methyltransferase n=1 Tax=Ammonifex thiophilus TaxID=444093 RepID=A0A3D8P657_9THEO|nr:precorrin-2 C(20)-methyltransferase [Ammonifex thiophilus]RDV83630.1 precorrin-2 C(20)-methyltransferase [Ammonifex thiophilus]